MQKNQCLKTGDGDTQVGLDAQCPMEEFVVLWPGGRHKLLRHLWTEMLNDFAFVLHFCTDGAVVQVAQGSQREDEVNTAEVPWIIGGCSSIIEVVQYPIKLLAFEDGAVEVEVGKVRVHNVFGRIAILGKPDLDIGRGEHGVANRHGHARCGRVAWNRDLDPLAGVTRSDIKFDGAVPARSKTVGPNSEVFSVVWTAFHDVVDDCRGDTKVLCQGLRVGHVVAIGIGPLLHACGCWRWRGRGLHGRRRADDGRCILEAGMHVWRVWRPLEVVDRWWIPWWWWVGAWHHVRVLRVRRGLGGHGGLVALRTGTPARRFELECRINMGGGIDEIRVKILPGHDGFEVIERKSGVPELEQGLTLSELVLDMLGVATGSEGLTMTVLLVADGTGGSACSASWMFGVALRG